ncbi:hypothetical protein E2562_020510 [Oryza meyeriana var. granulata]|uniref:Uncharacterized protein n=1 Tax=Oryza meyeriana var. granulata TaxID=110450 RepID=A0A6G1EAX7_9ORYZ|nr:hypothetical protein E2562_020510 [Oryza meyeriana var. granulata]
MMKEAHLDGDSLDCEPADLLLPRSNVAGSSKKMLWSRPSNHLGYQTKSPARWRRRHEGPDPAAPELGSIGSSCPKLGGLRIWPPHHLLHYVSSTCRIRLLGLGDGEGSRREHLSYGGLEAANTTRGVEAGAGTGTGIVVCMDDVSSLLLES